MGNRKHSGNNGKKKCSECPVPSNANYNGINGGKNGGRVCWIILGTLCNENQQLVGTRQLEGCADCDFYRAVKEEEGKDLCLRLDTIQNAL